MGINSDYLNELCDLYCLHAHNKKLGNTFSDYFLSEVETWCKVSAKATNTSFEVGSGCGEISCRFLYGTKIVAHATARATTENNKSESFTDLIYRAFGCTPVKAPKGGMHWSIPGLKDKDLEDQETFRLKHYGQLQGLPASSADAVFQLSKYCWKELNKEIMIQVGWFRGEGFRLLSLELI